MMLPLLFFTLGAFHDTLTTVCFPLVSTVAFKECGGLPSAVAVLSSNSKWAPPPPLKPHPPPPLKPHPPPPLKPHPPPPLKPHPPPPLKPQPPPPLNPHPPPTDPKALYLLPS